MAHPLWKLHRAHMSMKIVRRCFAPWSQRVALRDPQIPLMQKHKFGVTCPSALFMETAPGPPSMKNSESTLCAPDAPNALRELQIPTDAKTQVPRKMSQCIFLSNSYWYQPSIKNSVLPFRSPDATECTMWNADPTGCKKHKFGVMCPDIFFCQIRTDPTGAWNIVRWHLTPRTYQNAVWDP
jgi:hypothetical protein